MIGSAADELLTRRAAGRLSSVEEYSLDSDHAECLFIGWVFYVALRCLTRTVYEQTTTWTPAHPRRGHTGRGHPRGLIALRRVVDPMISGFIDSLIH